MNQTDIKGGGIKDLSHSQTMSVSVHHVSSFH